MERDRVNPVLSPTIEDLMIYNKIFKRLLQCKCFSLIFCITGTVIMFLLPLDFIDSHFIAVILPSFLTGYIIVNVGGILTACQGHADLITDIFLASFGVLGNACCGIFLFYYWIDWVASTTETGHGAEGSLFLVLSLSSILNTAAMGAQLVSSVWEIKRRVVSLAEDDHSSL